MRAAAQWGGRHGRALTLMVIPSVIGLVPMPGGALFSAPLVEQTVREKEWTPDWKAAVNYWFRHVWEYWWPLYPVVIVSLPIFDMETWAFMGTTFWFSPVAIIAGYLFLVRPHLDRLSVSEAGAQASHRRVAWLAVPLLVVVVSMLFLPLILRGWFPDMDLGVRKMLAMLMGMAFGIVLMAWDERRRGRRDMFKGILSRKTAQLLTTLDGVLIFQSLLDTSGLLPAAGAGLSSRGGSLFLVTALLPFIAGLVTGIALGFAGTSFPLVVGLMQAEGSGMTPMSTLALAFGFGYAGMMLSPVHLCFVLTRNFFSASYRSIYRHIWPCVAVVMAASVVLHLLLRRLAW
jgi:integral membrane protein (TIGR00529 family)